VNTANGPTIDKDVAGRFWDLANYITGFAVLQGVTFVIAVPASTLRGQLVHSKWLALTITLVSAGCYVWGVLSCGASERELRGGQGSVVDHARKASLLRSGAIGLVTLLVMLTIWVL
jgi:hypothetical protein